ncbi:MAG: hypothetical protein ACXU8N_15305 [Telluria sp.]
MTLRIALFLLLLFISNFKVATAERSDSARTWTTKPWTIRYLLFASSASSMRALVHSAEEWNRTQIGPETASYLFFEAPALFTPKVLADGSNGFGLAVQVLEFNRNGRLTGHRSRFDGWIARLSLRGDIVAVPSEDSVTRPFELASWSQGVPGEIGFSPAVCSVTDILRYEGPNRWPRDSYGGAFGCREWTAQLYDPDQPYIDVTSGVGRRGAIIGEVLGWARFADPPKPVIGKQDHTWYCLHECPDGEKPGAIPDIRKWTAKHGFPMPQKPPRRPIYPNSRYREAFEIE